MIPLHIQRTILFIIFPYQAHEFTEREKCWLAHARSRRWSHSFVPRQTSGTHIKRRKGLSAWIRRRSNCHPAGLNIARENISLAAGDGKNLSSSSFARGLEIFRTISVSLLHTLTYRSWLIVPWTSLVATNDGEFWPWLRGRERKTFGRPYQAHSPSRKIGARVIIIDIVAACMYSKGNTEEEDINWPWVSLVALSRA